jgi:hypothetical protein
MLGASVVSSKRWIVVRVLKTVVRATHVNKYGEPRPLVAGLRLVPGRPYHFLFVIFRLSSVIAPELAFAVNDK